MTLALFVLTQYRRVTDIRTDGRTDGQTRCDHYYPRQHSVARLTRKPSCRSQTRATRCNVIVAPQRRNAQQYRRNLCIDKKYIQWATILSLTIRVYLHSFSRYCLPNVRNRTKFREILTLWQFKVIQGHRSLGVNGKPMCDFILVINSNFSRICHRFRDIHG